MNSCLLITIFSFSCCPVSRTTSSQTIETYSSTTVSDHYEKLYEALLDSVRNIPAPVENSRNYGIWDSYLETSLAWSSFSTDSLGNPDHRIGNKDSIPTTVRYIITDRIIWDTVYMDKVTEDIKTETETIVIELNTWQKIRIHIGDISMVIALLIGIYKVIKWKLKL